MNTGCPRTVIHETALQLLQILDKRFFGSVSPLGSAEDDQDQEGGGTNKGNASADENRPEEGNVYYRGML